MSLLTRSGVVVATDCVAVVTVLAVPSISNGVDVDATGSMDFVADVVAVDGVTDVLAVIGSPSKRLLISLASNNVVPAVTKTPVAPNPPFAVGIVEIVVADVGVAVEDVLASIVLGSNVVAVGVVVPTTSPYVEISGSTVCPTPATGVPNPLTAVDPALTVDTDCALVGVGAVAVVVTLPDGVWLAVLAVGVAVAGVVVADADGSETVVSETGDVVAWRPYISTISNFQSSGFDPISGCAKISSSIYPVLEKSSPSYSPVS